MANPVVLDWLDENSFRSYPIKESVQKVSSLSTILTNNVILDASIVFPSVQANCELTSIVVTDTTATFNITTGQSFVIDKTATFPQYVRNAQHSLLVVGEGILQFPNGTHNFSSLAFEPSVVTEFTAEWLGVTSLAHNSSPMTGVINLLEGYQVGLSSTKNTITIGADNLLGKPIGCDIPADFVSDCSEIVSSINGVTPDGNSRLFITPGNNIVVWDDPDNHRIYVGYSFVSADDICKDIPPFPII